MIILLSFYFQFELSAKNLDNLMGSKRSGSNEEKEQSLDFEFNSKSDSAQIDLDLSLMNKKLIRLNLFRSYSEMLKLIWSIPSKYKSFFGTNILVADQTSLLMLSNGMLLEIDLLGALSFDLSASNELSVWSQQTTARARAR